MHLHLVTIHVGPSPQAVPLAAAFLQARIAAHRSSSEAIQVTQAEYYPETPIATILATVDKLRPQCVGFVLYLWNRQQSGEIARELRRLQPEVILIGGGPEATADPAGILAAAPYDYLVLGEGEETLVALLERLQRGVALDDLEGIAQRDAAGTRMHLRPPCADLDLLPSPWLSGLLDSHIPKGVLWQLTRGCSFACDFCYDGMGERTVRRFSLQRLEAELDYLLEHDVRQVFVLDSTFNQDVERAKTLLRLLGRKAPGVHFHFEVRHEFLDAESARLFAGLTCSLQIGLQSANPEVLQGVGRRFDRERFTRKINLLNQAGATFGFDLIYGLPGDSLATFCESLDFALGLYPNQLDIFPLALLPGTRLAARAQACGLDYRSDPPYTLESSPTFPAPDLAVARRLGAASDLFYSRGKAVAWFNGIICALKLRPSDFLRAFADWLLAATGREVAVVGYDDAAIWRLQRDFLAVIFVRHQAQRLLPLALDFVDYHYHYAAAVQSSPERPRPLRGDLLRTPLRCSTKLRLATFHYPIDQLLACGEPRLAACAARFRPGASFALIYPACHEVCTETVPEPYFRLLQQLDGRTPAGRIAAALGLGPEDARTFLGVAIGEGIVLAA